MYKANNNTQLSLDDFNQPLGLHMNPKNRWVVLADMIPWDTYEEKYAKLFKKQVGNVAKPCRMALGALIIQKKLGFSDRELVQEITENPYLQYFIGLPGYQEEPPFEASSLVAFRKRLDLKLVMSINEILLDSNCENAPSKKAKSRDDDNDKRGGASGGSDEAPRNTSEAAQNSDSSNPPSQSVDTQNKGTLILDATCAPSNIRYPQDFSLLNEAREKLEGIIRRICKDNHEYMPRTYCREARKNYLDLAKSKKRSAKKIRKVIRKQLGYVNRDLGYIESYCNKGYQLQPKEQELIKTIRKVYEQQKYMFDNHSHKVADRIVSLQQPYIRPIVRGKVKAPVEFGVKFDLSLDEQGMGRIEKISFDPYNESGTLKDAVEAYRSRTGHYPERVLADQIYRTRENRTYCKTHGIRLSGPKLGRPGLTQQPIDKKLEYKDNTDRIEVERSFSLSKRCYGLGLILTKREDTTYGSIALSIFVTNLFRILDRSGLLFFAFFAERPFWAFSSKEATIGAGENATLALIF